MIPRLVFSSVTRISDFPDSDIDVVKLDRQEWATGDYVVGRVLDTTRTLHTVELPNGRMAEVTEGDRVIGAFGARAATLEAVGTWREIGNDLRFDALTTAGLFGKATSRSPFIAVPMPLAYEGHVSVDGRKATMFDYALSPEPSSFSIPVVMVIGTSMSAGKTTSARLVIRLLRDFGLNVVAAKLTGAARYRDVLSFADAGAQHIFDFVDVGLPSTVCDEAVFSNALEKLLSRIGSCGADILVAEAGASPLEPYNGSVAVKMIGSNIKFTVLCASDPYAVLGVTKAFGTQPDIVAGGAANTTAGIDLVRNLTGLPALDVFDRDTGATLKSLLSRVVGDIRG